MCTNRIEIFNKRTGRKQYVNCGHCKSCMQAKANKRTARIRNHEQSSGRICLFVTLTYDNKFIPYVRPSELLGFDSSGCNSVFHSGNIIVHRDYDVRYVRSVHKNDRYRQIPKAIPGEDVFIPFEPFSRARQEFCSNWYDNCSKLPLLRKKYNGKFISVDDKVGVGLYSDIQKFYKRFEINFFREYGYKPKRSYWFTLEYGETYTRPHFHLLLFCEPAEKTAFEYHVRKAWPYTGHWKNAVDIQVARNVASYVSSYVNCGSDFPQFLKLWFKPASHGSQYFGYDNFYYSLPSILRMFESNSWSYPCTRMLDGKTFVQDVPLPRYVLNRWFPQFTGYSRLSDNTLFDVAYRPLSLQCLRPFTCQKIDVQGSFTVRLRNASLRYRRQFMDVGDKVQSFILRGEYAYIYSRIWQSYISFLQRWSYENYDVFDTWFNYYENIGDVIDTHIIDHDLAHVPLPKDVPVYRHPDLQPWNVRISRRYADLYDKKKKQSKISNFALTDGLGKYV